MFHNNKAPMNNLLKYKDMSNLLNVQKLHKDLGKVLNRVSFTCLNNYCKARKAIKKDGSFDVCLFDAYFISAYDMFNDNDDLFEAFVDGYEGTKDDIIKMFKELYGSAVEELPDFLRNAINWDDVISDFIRFECFDVNYNNETYYFRYA